MPEAAQKTYLLECRNHVLRKVTIPASWKVTFGPLVPGAHGDGTLALRVYETKDKQRAVFMGVVAFRDLDVKVEERRLKNVTTVETKSDGDEMVEQTLLESGWKLLEEDFIHVAECAPEKGRLGRF